jgi:aryl-alcohol dehydrogenase-like predicted oxidoreductase
MQTGTVIRRIRWIQKQTPGIRTVVVLWSILAILLSSCFPTLGMEYVEVCDQQNHCKKFSRLIMGTDHLAQSGWTEDRQPQMSDEQINALLDEAVKLGINVFDTSPIYVGGIQNKLGKWINSRKEGIRQNDFYSDDRLNPDKKLYVISKGGFPFDLYYSKKLEPGTHSYELLSQLCTEGILKSDRSSGDESLPLHNVPPGTYASRLFGSKEQIIKRVSKELGDSSNDFAPHIITIYLMHRDDNDYVRFKRVLREQTPVRTIMESLGEGEIATQYWMIGWSNWETERVDESIRLASDSRLPKPALNSPYFSLFEMGERSIHAGGIQVTHEEMMNPNFQEGIKLMSYSPLGGFSILDKPEPRWENARKAAKKKFDAGDPYWQNVFYSIFTEANQKRYKRVVAFTETFNKQNNTDYTVDQMINAYALAHRRTDFLTVGPITVEQLRRTVGGLKLSRRLTEADLEYLYSGIDKNQPCGQISHNELILNASTLRGRERPFCLSPVNSPVF